MPQRARVLGPHPQGLSARSGIFRWELATRRAWRSWRAALLAASLPLLATAPSLASDNQELCSFSIRSNAQGPEQKAWGRAARTLQEQAQRGQVPLRCKRLLLRVQHNGALLAFYVSDGRRAVRFMRAPDELVPTVTALSIVAPAGGPFPPPEPSAKLPFEDPATHPERPTEPNERSEPVELHATLQAGMRGGQGGLVTPLLVGRALWTNGAGELGVRASVERAYQSLEASPPSFGAGIQAGVSHELGALTLHTGADAEIAVLHGNAQQADRSEARLGAYTALDSGTWLAIPIRADVGLSFTPARLWDTTDDPPGSPWWALSFTLGVEFGGA